MSRNKKIFIITITFLMLAGLTTITATSIDTNDTTTQTNTIDSTTQINKINYDTTSTNESSTSSTDNMQEITNSEEPINNKTGSKTQNLKANTRVTANNFNELRSYLTSNTYNTVTIDIGDDIQLAENIQVDTAIKTLTINGNKKIINGMGYRFLYILTGTTTVIDNIIITNCTTVNGGAIYNRGTLTITNTNLAYNYATNRGGAIYNDQGNLTINNSTLTYNNATVNGGAIFNNANLTITNSNLNNNNAENGGAICSFLGKITTVNTNITHNRVSKQGGAIFNNGANLNTTNTNITANNANQGGAIFNNEANLTITNTNINDNNATSGGAISNRRGSITITYSNLNNNIAPYNESRGGVIYSEYGNISINNTNLTNNYVEYNGGAIYSSNGNLTIDYSNLTNNTAKIHGGAIYNGYANLTVTNSNLNYNNVTGSGGAIHNNFGKVTANNNIINHNTATSQGGAILSNCGDMTISNSTINYNSAKYGGAIYLNNRTNELIKTNISIFDSTFDNNSAISSGGVICSNGYVVLKNSNITNNYVTSNQGYVIDITNSSSNIITDNKFINNTDNTRDMLFSYAKNGSEVDIHDNSYIDNYLEDSIVKPNVMVVTDNETRVYDYYVDVVLRSIYNDNVRNGTLHVYVNNVLTDTTDVSNGRSRIFIKNSDLTNRENNITLEYISQNKHYQNVTTNFIIQKEINTTLSIQAPSTMDAGDNAVINFTLVDVNNNPLRGETINVFVDEEHVVTLTTDENGVANYTFNAFGDELVRIEATHHTSSDSIYLSAMDVEAEIDVNKIEPEIFIVPGKITPQAESNITIQLFDPDGNPIKNKTLTVNITEEGKPDIIGTVTTDENGKAVFNFTPVDEGTLNVTVISPSDDIYHYANATVQMGPEFITTNLLVTASSMLINQTNTISVEVLAGDGALLSGTVELDIDGEIHTLTINNGRGTYHDYQSDTAGEKLVNAKFISNIPGYANATTTEEFNVGKLPTHVTIEVINRTAGNVTLKILVFSKYNTGSIVNGGNIVIESVNGETRTVIYNGILENGELIYLTDINETGWYEFATEYFGNDYFFGELNNTGSIEILSVNTNITVFDKNALVGDTITLNATIIDVDGNPVNDGTVRFFIDGSQLYDENGNPVEAKVVNGIATTEYTLPTIYTQGNYTITANYAGNNKYNTSSGEAKLTIDLKETSIGGTLLNNTKGNTIIEVTLNTTDDNEPIPDAEIIVKDEDGKIVGEGITDENGIAIITLDLPIGENNITIIYLGDGIYSPDEESMTINVIPRESKTTGTLVNNTVGNVTIDVEVVDAETGEPVTGPVRIIVEGNVVGTGVLDDDGRATIPTDIDVKGNYTIMVEYEGNDDYYGSNDTLDDVNIDGKDVDMDVVVVNRTVGNTTINVTLTDPETDEPIPNATIIVTIPDGTNVTGTTDENGTVIIPLDLPSGDNNLTITYPGNDTYNSQEKNITVKVQSYSVVMVGAVEGFVLDNVTFTAYVRDYQGNLVTGGFVQFNVGGKTLKDENGKNIRVFVENGIAKLSYRAESGWIVDSHPNLKVQAVYTGTSILLQNRSDISKVTIYKRNATVQVSAPDDYVNGTLHIDAVVRDQNGSLINDGVLVFKLNGLSVKDENNKGIIANVVNGKVHLDVKLPFVYSAKKYNLTAVYSNKIYNKVSGINTTNLKPIPTYVNATVTIKNEYSKPVVTGQIYNKFNNAILEGIAIINIKFDGISYAKKVKVNNGTFNETIGGISIYKPGTHKVEVVFGDTYHYQSARKTIKTTATLKYNTTTEFTNITRNKTTTRVQARIIDDKNNNVQRNLTITIKLNGKSFLVNEKVMNGNVDILIDTSSLSNRNYTLELVSGANTYYKASSTTTELPKY